eukprot:3833319-Amphidinium_carterae.1
MRHGHSAPCDSIWAGTYVDDFGQVAVLDPRLPPPFDQASVLKRAQSEHQNLLTGYREVGIVRKSEKSVAERSECSIWGASLSSTSRSAQSSPDKRRALMHATLLVCASRRSTAGHVQILLGHWMHQLLFKREMMCVLTLTFGWVHAHRGHPRARIVLPRRVKDELVALCLLAPVMKFDLTAPISRWAVATDATLLRGAATVAPLSPEAATTLFLRSDRAPQIMEFIRGEIDEDMFVAKYTRAPDVLVHDLVGSLSFTTVAPYAFREVQHVNKQEGLAWRSGVFAALRRSMIQGTRCICLLDSAVFAGAIKKGRSSSRRLNSVLRSVMPDLVLHSTSILPVWIGTKHNPADDPTRGQRVRLPSPPSMELHRQIVSVVSQASFVHHMAHLQWADAQRENANGLPRPRRSVCMGCSCASGLVKCSRCGCWTCVACCHPRSEAVEGGHWCEGHSENCLPVGSHSLPRCFDSTKGYPGEGPPQNHLKSAAIGDLGSRVQRVTEVRYEQRYRALCTWMAAQNFPTAESMVERGSWQGVDAMLTAYIQGLHTSCEPISHGSYTLAAFQYRWPEAVGKIPRCWLAQKQWARLQPPNIRCPMPLKVMLALASAAWVMAYPRMTVGFLISFLGLLRPGEWAALRRQHVVLPVDLSGAESTMTIAIMQAKTSTRGPRIQSVLISDPLVVQLTQAVIGSDPPSTPLIRGGLRTVAPLFEQIRGQVMLQHSAFTLSTMRGGGAIYHLQSCQSIAYLQWLGRWSTEKSVSHYLQLGLAASAMAGIPDAARALVLRLAELAPVLLSTAMVPQPALQPVTREKDGWAAAAERWTC